MNNLILNKVAKTLNSSGCLWAVGGSTLLNQYGLLNNPKDIDILIDPKDENRIKSFMNKIGNLIDIKKKDEFKSNKFFRYDINGIIVEFIGGFKIAFGENKLYEVIFDDKSIVSSINKDCVKINLMSLEDWFVIYKVMNDPKCRLPLIMKYFKDNGIKYKSILYRNLTLQIPIEVKNSIESLLNT